ncbi:phosphotransferase family protein [Bradyrhizobium sp.]|uniref:phosphotransferase family protein n=1 Tax=Bradyrhizobium sp. TaxID=376 RepID=UPI001D1EC6C2|nr:aminoglycoside phosphotransferase family protein [Bradyrhizobium sp.]MBV8697563.1 aminoglycoside phosphotransferase family protein [Bradyrhizobium sp.]MBV8919108.1 aminoglycoside phosphotransferase family protein [Bradyrhizobium sp.]
MPRLTFDLELDQVRAIVRELDGALDPVRFARLSGGTSDVYRIDLARGKNPLVLKIYADEQPWVVAKEALVAGWIGERADLPIPRWLCIDERRRLIPFRFALTTWLPGMTVRRLIGTDGIDAAYRQMGELLRRLHSIPMTAYGYIKDDGIQRPVPSNDDYMRAAFEQAFRQFREQGADEILTRRLQEQAQARFPLLQSSAGSVFCHDDLQQGNVLAERDGSGGLKLTGLIDFGNARAGDALFDLAKALFCCGHEDPGSRTPLLAGYGEIDHPDAEGAIWLYTLFHSVSMWCWLTRHGLASDGGAGLLRDLDAMSR